MEDADKTKEQLITELAELRRQIVDMPGHLRLSEMSEMARQDTKAQFHRRVQKMTLLNRVTTLTASAEDMTEALHDICAELACFVQVSQAGFAILNPERTAAEVVADFHPSDSSSAIGMIIPVDGNPSLAYILEHKTPLSVAEAQTDPLLAPVHEVMRQRNVQSILLVPILVEREVIGTLGFDAFQRRMFSRADVELVQHVANQVGPLLMWKQAEEELRRHREHLGELVEERTAELRRVNDELIREIVERKQAEQALAQSEERYRRLVEEIEGEYLIYSHDPDGTFRYMNPGAKDILGRKLHKIIGRNWREVVDAVPKSLKNGNRSDRMCIEGKVPEAYEFEFRHPDGGVRTLEIQSRPVFDANGEVFAIEGIAKDITQRKKAEQALQKAHDALQQLNVELEDRVRERTAALESANRELRNEIVERKRAEKALRQREQEFKTLVEHNPDMVARFDRECRHIYVNPAVEKELGAPPQAILGKTHRELGMPAEQADWLEEIIHQVFERGQERVFETVIPTHEGVKHYLTRGVPEFAEDGSVASALFIHRNVTERMQAEETLKWRNRELALFNRVIAATASTLDVEQVLQIACQELAQAFDLPQAAAALLNAERTAVTVVAEYLAPGRPSALGTTVSVAGNPAMEYVLAHKAPLVVADAQTDERMASAHDLMREHGTVSLLAVPIMERGEVAGGIGLNTIERHEFSDEEINLAQNVAAAAGQALETARLYQELERHAAELARTLEQRQELDRIRREFIRNVSHELRTPLAIARGNVELLEAGILGELQPEQRKPVAVIARRMRMLSKIVDGITAVLDTEGQGLTRESVDLAGLVQAMLAEFQGIAEQARLTLATRVMPDPPPVLGDPVQLQQVLDHLLDNARKFTPAGGQVTVRLWQEGENLVLEVSDTGIGIPTDQLQRVFERFFQIDGSATRRYGGTGLGLALVKEIVEAHGGRVTVQSTVGRGSTFIVTLPTGPVDISHRT